MADRQPGEIEIPYQSTQQEGEGKDGTPLDFQKTKEALKRRFGLDFRGSNGAGDRAIFKDSQGRPWDQRPVPNPDPNGQSHEWRVIGPDRQEKFRYDENLNRNILPPEQGQLPLEPGQPAQQGQQ